MSCTHCAHCTHDGGESAGPRCPACARERAVTYNRAYQKRLRKRLKLTEGEDSAEQSSPLFSMALKSQAEVARQLGIGRDRVTRIERTALLKIRKWYRKMEKSPAASGSVAAALEKYDRQIVRWRRLLRRSVLNHCHRPEVRELVFEVAQCEMALERARIELGL